jgi:hypothetical protein
MAILPISTSIRRAPCSTGACRRWATSRSRERTDAGHRWVAPGRCPRQRCLHPAGAATDAGAAGRALSHFVDHASKPTVSRCARCGSAWAARSIRAWRRPQRAADGKDRVGTEILLDSTCRLRPLAFWLAPSVDAHCRCEAGAGWQLILAAWRPPTARTKRAGTHWVPALSFYIGLVQACSATGGRT